MKAALPVIPIILAFLILNTTAMADVFEDDRFECFQVLRVVDGNIYVKAEGSGQSGEEILDVSATNPRRSQILAKAQEAASNRQMLCGSVRGFSVRDVAGTSQNQLSGADLENFCEEAKENYKKSKGWEGLLGGSRYTEVEDVYSMCMATRGKSVTSAESGEDKVERYYSCLDAAEKALVECASSADPQVCIKFLLIQKRSFKDEVDFALLRADSGKIFVQCRIDGRAPSRRGELDAPTRGNLNGELSRPSQGVH